LLWNDGTPKLNLIIDPVIESWVVHNSDFNECQLPVFI